MDMTRQDFISAPRPPSRLTFNPVPLASATPINSAISGTPGNGTNGLKPISLQRLRSCSKNVAASVAEAEPVFVPSVGAKRLIRMRGDDAFISGLDRAVLDGHVTDAVRILYHQICGVYPSCDHTMVVVVHFDVRLVW